MSGHRFFNNLRSGLAPLIRPVLEGVGPVRRLGLWVLSRRHPDEVELDGQTFKVDPRDFGVTLELHSTGPTNPSRGLCLESLEPGMVFLDIGAHGTLFIAIETCRASGHSHRIRAASLQSVAVDGEHRSKPCRERDGRPGGGVR